MSDVQNIPDISRINVKDSLYNVKDKFARERLTSIARRLENDLDIKVVDDALMFGFLKGEADWVKFSVYDKALIIE